MKWMDEMNEWNEAIKEWGSRRVIRHWVMWWNSVLGWKFIAEKTIHQYADIKIINKRKIHPSDGYLSLLNLSLWWYEDSSLTW